MQEIQKVASPDVSFMLLSCSLPLFPGRRMVEYSLDLQNINLSAIRTVRVLRPLKAINRVPSKQHQRLAVPH